VVGGGWASTLAWWKYVSVLAAKCVRVLGEKAERSGDRDGERGRSREQRHERTGAREENV